MLLKTSYKMKPPISARLIPGHPLADKLVACYLMNEGSGVIAHDSSGRGHHGTLTGGATWTTGKFGRAIDLDGIDGHIVIPDHADFTPALHPFSVSADVYMHDATNFSVASKGELNVDGEWLFTFDASDRITANLKDESVDSCYIGRRSAVAFTAHENRWVNAIFVYDGGATEASIKLYFEAVRADVANSSSNGASFVSVENLAGVARIGRYSTSYANGVVANVMIWRRVLTQSDIVRLCADRFCMFEQRRRLLAGAPL